MVHDILFALWFLLPAALANMTPIFSSLLPGLRSWQTPIDFGRRFRGQHIFGHHKTWRGLFSGMIVSTLTLWLQQIAVRHYGWAASWSAGVVYASLPTLVLGPLFGFGALMGDAIESFFKRQRGIPPGGRWVPFDQIDYILGAIIISLFFVRLRLIEYVYLLLLWFVMHLLSTYVGWLLKLKASPV